MPATRQGDTTMMTPGTVQAMINQALQRNSTNTHNDGSQNSGGGPGWPVQPARVKGNDVGGYTQRFQELALMCTKFLSDEIEKVDKYISRLPDNIHGNAYAVGSGEKKLYGGSKPLYPKFNYHHDGECAPKCTNCKKVGHLTKDCWHPINANNQRTITCYECGNQGHYRSDCPVLKNQGTEARGMVYALGGGETDQDINNMEDDINA
ncbi:reverse transcriptase domain-containing protein [Tanacetum coccineum]